MGRALKGSLRGEAVSVAIVAAKFNSLVTDRLLAGAFEALEATGVPAGNVDVAFVPGSFELPVVAKAMAETGKYGAVICIGAVVRGSTTHYEEVCSAATSGCLNASTTTGARVTLAAALPALAPSTHALHCSLHVHDLDMPKAVTASAGSNVQCMCAAILGV